MASTVLGASSKHGPRVGVAMLRLCPRSHRRLANSLVFAGVQLAIFTGLQELFEVLLLYRKCCVAVFPQMVMRDAAIVDLPA